MELDYASSTIQQALSSLWFKRFMQGAHRKMGDVWLPDKTVNKYFIKPCFNVLEHNWEVHCIENHSQLLISKAVCIISTGYYSSLQREELGKVDLGGII